MILWRNYSELLASNTAREGFEMCEKRTILVDKQQKIHETGPYASVWRDSRAVSILRALRSPWDASWPLKPPKNILKKHKKTFIKNGFWGLGAKG